MTILRRLVALIDAPIRDAMAIGEARATAAAFMAQIRRDLLIAGMWRDCIHGRDGHSCANCGRSIGDHDEVGPGRFRCRPGRELPEAPTRDAFPRSAYALGLILGIVAGLVVTAVAGVVT